MKMNRVVLITGGGKGLGLHIAKGFAAEKDKIAILGRDDKSLDAANEEISKINPEIISIKADISDALQVTKAVQKTIGHFGRLDIAILNAGIYLEKNFVEMSLEEWGRIIQTNLTGNFLITKEIVSHFISQSGGRIICISSVGGHTGLAKKSAYCASKFGLTGFFKSLSKELKPHKIAINIVYPYYIDSHLELDWDNKKDEILNIWHPEDAVKLILFLANQPLRATIEDVYLDIFGKK